MSFADRFIELVREGKYEEGQEELRLFMQVESIKRYERPVEELTEIEYYSMVDDLTRNVLETIYTQEDSLELIELVHGVSPIQQETVYEEFDEELWEEDDADVFPELVEIDVTIENGEAYLDFDDNEVDILTIRWNGVTFSILNPDSEVL
jgi:hypothetical protein